MNKFQKIKTLSFIMITLLIIILNVVSLQANTVHAEDGWILNPINGHTYRLTENLSWFDAETQAVAWGGHLVTLDNHDEEWWIKGTFGDDEHFWIGFNDIKEEGVWVWSSGALVGYTNWDTVEPNNCCDCTDYPGCEDAAVMNWQAETGSGPFGDFWNDLAPTGQMRAVVERDYLQIEIDIKPGSESNNINLNSKGNVPVVILTTSDFDAATVDPFTIVFANATTLRWALSDVDGDMDLDLILHYRTQELELDENSTVADLIGYTYEGKTIKGSDKISIVPMNHQ